MIEKMFDSFSSNYLPLFLDKWKFIVIFTLLIYLLFYVFLKKRKINHFSLIILSLSISFIISITFLERKINFDNREFQFQLFWSYKEMKYALQPMDLLMSNVCNVLMFIPYGISLPIAFIRFRKFKYTFICILLTTVIIEFIQGVFGLGLCETDDVFHNALGGVIGYLIAVKVLAKIKPLLVKIKEIFYKRSKR